MLRGQRQKKCPWPECDLISFTTTEEMVSHFETKHGLNEEDMSSDEAVSCETKRARLEVKSMSSDFPKTSILSSCLTSPYKPKVFTQPTSWISCSHCSFKCESKLILRSHYSTHRSNKAPYLCLECGSSFVTFLSLERHLLSQHSIADSKEYLKKNLSDLYKLHFDQEDVNLLEIIHDQQSTVSTCPICSKTCLDSVDLKSHVKVHGMAFIKSCQKIVNISNSGSRSSSSNSSNNNSNRNTNKQILPITLANC